MPRARGNSSDRGNRFNTFVSGVTFQTNPSGVTLSKGSGIQGDVMTNSGGAGYTLPFLGASGLLCDIGEVGITAGVTKIEAAYFGFSAIYFCLATAGSTNVINKSAATGAVVVTTANGFKSAGVSRVYFRYFGDAGTKLLKPVSAQYFAIGV